LSFEELPPDIQSYIVVCAARLFAKDVLGSETLTSITAEDEHKALVLMKQEEARRANQNFFTSNPLGHPTLRRRSVLGRF
jgi:hypothetical protein